MDVKIKYYNTIIVLITLTITNFLWLVISLFVYRNIDM